MILYNSKILQNAVSVTQFLQPYRCLAPASIHWRNPLINIYGVLMALTSVLVGQLTKESVFLIGVIMVIIKSLHKTHFLTDVRQQYI